MMMTAAALVWAVPASAHAELESSTPADGATLKLAPKQVQFVFGEDLLPGSIATTAKDLGTDAAVALPEPELAGNTVTVVWPADLPGGQYRVAYRVVSADGHPITGRISFTYRQARVTASQVNPATPTATPSDQAPSITDSAQALAPTPVKAPVSPGALGAILAVGVLALVALGFGAWHTRRSRGL